MQDQWFGDEGDFVKFRFLRQICGITAKDDGPRLSLGVVWYKREPKSLAYLESGSGGEGYETEDGDLFRSLRGWMRNERCGGVSLIEKSGLFPPDTVWFPNLVPPSSSDRDEWLKIALAKVSGRDMVFLDPDTGLQPKKGTGDHVLYGELKKFCDAVSEPTVVVYQHRRHQKWEDQVEEQTAQIKKWSARDCVVAVRRRRLDNRLDPRLFYVIPSKREKDREVVLKRIRELQWCTNPDLGRDSAPAD